MKRLFIFLLVLSLFIAPGLAQGSRAPAGAGAGSSGAGGEDSETVRSGAAGSESDGAAFGEGYGASQARRDLARLRLRAEERKRIAELLEKGSATMERDRERIRDLQRTLARVLLGAEPSRDRLGALVRESVEIEYTLRMAALERHLAIRALIGDDRWAALFRLSRAAANRSTLRAFTALVRDSGLSADEAAALLKLFEGLEP